MTVINEFLVAYNEVSSHEVAVKIMNKKKIKQQGVFEKVKREIKVLRLFNHPHIIKHYEFIDTPSDIFMAIEYAENGELFDMISQKGRVSTRILICYYLLSHWSQDIWVGDGIDSIHCLLVNSFIEFN